MSKKVLALAKATKMRARDLIPPSDERHSILRSHGCTSKLTLVISCQVASRQSTAGSQVHDRPAAHLGACSAAREGKGRKRIALWDHQEMCKAVQEFWSNQASELFCPSKGKQAKTPGHGHRSAGGRGGQKDSSWRGCSELCLRAQ